MSIPKIAFSFWEGPEFTYLNYLTIYSFAKYNPDYRIIIYTTNDTPICDKTMFQSVVKYHNLYDFNELRKIPNVEIQVVNIKDLVNYDGILTPVWKSDIIRIWKLYEHGGIYIDFDILFIKSLPKFFPLLKTQFATFTYLNVVSNGFLIAPKNGRVVKLILDIIIQKIKKNQVGKGYEQFGPTLYTKLFVIPDLASDITYLPNDLLFPYLYNETDKLFQSNIDQTTSNTFGIHWFNGDKIARFYNNQLDIKRLNPNEIIMDKFIQQVIST